MPTFNGASSIHECLNALVRETAGRDAEIVVVDDGSTDGTADIVRQFPGSRLITQANAGPASARNRGASEAGGQLLLFTDDDCVPAPGWLDSMLAPFDDEEVVGAKGVYRTRQSSLVARFVQIEYEDRYRRMNRFPCIDFIDTYSAAFRRDRFLELSGYDTSFPVACAEDVELSYRMSARGWKMRFVPAAAVYHTHPDTLWKYLQKKFKFAFWRVMAVEKNPRKAVKDSHTPQTMKLQLLLVPALLVALGVDLRAHTHLLFTPLVLGMFLASVLPFVARALVKDPMVGILSPLLLCGRATAQFLGVAAGFVHAGYHLATAMEKRKGVARHASAD